jgi:threonine/homoserine/homoserine lactone efflux protein
VPGPETPIRCGRPTGAATEPVITAWWAPVEWFRNSDELGAVAGYRARVPSVETLVTFALAGIVLVVIPGPSVLFIVGRALAHGRRAALTSVAGNTTGASLVVVVVALGLGAVAAQSVAVFTVLKLVGAAYLIYLGVHTFRTRGDLAELLGRPAGGADRRMYWQGVVVGFTNPKVLVFFAAVLPQFVDTGAGSPTSQMLVLGLLFALIAAGLDSLWGMAAGTARAWFATSPARLRRLGGAGGLMMIVMGTGLALTGRKD